MKENVNSVVMVEGYMDVIALYQAGICNAMASMGTALTEKQARLIKRYVDKVIICYDGDAAGQKATVRGLDILYKAGLDVKVMSLPEGLDPDEYIKKYGREQYMTLMMDALPLFEFKLRKLAESFDLTTAEGKGKYAVEAMKILKSKDFSFSLEESEENQQSCFSAVLSPKESYACLCFIAKIRHEEKMEQDLKKIIDALAKNTEKDSE